MLQQELGDTGMIPEAVLMEEMKPGGKAPQTAAPTIDITGNQIWISAATDGASLVYQTRQKDGWSNWKLYTKSLPVSVGQVRAQACRLGYRNSEIVTGP